VVRARVRCSSLVPIILGPVAPPHHRDNRNAPHSSIPWVRGGTTWVRGGAGPLGFATGATLSLTGPGPLAWTQRHQPVHIHIGPGASAGPQVKVVRWWTSS
jgi:hypothetical protein